MNSALAKPNTYGRAPWNKKLALFIYAYAFLLYKAPMV